MMKGPMPDRSFAAFLFDMDGTLLDSIAVANRIWRRWAERHGLDGAAIIKAIHGVPAIDTVRSFAPPVLDVEEEASSITQAEIDETAGILEIAGARSLLRKLPPDRWAVVTSAPRALALRRMEAAFLPMPAILITAEDVVLGKPAPDCFMAAAQALGVEASDCLIWEDSPAGIASAEAANGAVMIVSATHHAPMPTRHPQVRDYRNLDIRVEPDGRLRLIRHD